MSEIESLGDAIGGAVLARAVEPDTGVGVDGHTQERACLNCGTQLAGDYCHACGQHAHVHRTLGAFAHDLLHGVLHFEGKIWRTLPLLAWKPGELTRRYIDGQRACFVSPIALFLFSVFLMFAAASAIGGLNPTFDADGPQKLAQAEKDAVAVLAEARQERAAVADGSREATMLDRDIAEREVDLEVIRTMRSKGIAEAILGRRDAQVDADTNWLNLAYAKAKRNPQLLIYKLKTNAYKWSWALIPLSVPFVWLMFAFNRRFKVYDHVVFVTYSLAFMSSLVVLGIMLFYLGLGAMTALLALFAPVHIFWQLRGTYGLSKRAALWRALILVVAAGAVLTAFMLAMVALGVLD